jgi:CRP/FNR family transcriptional regulator, anaerobic regulatory protein
MQTALVSAPTPASANRTAPGAARHTMATSADSAGNRIAALMEDEFAIAHKRLKAGECLFRSGAPFNALYVINAGFAKTSYTSEDGREQITGFHLRGDILGLDAIATGTYGSDAIALDVSDVLVIPYEAVMAESAHNPLLMRELHSAFSEEIRNDRDLMFTIGSRSAEGRVAAFLLEMSERFSARGFSATKLQLRMTRQEIGSLLGLKLETVSRALSNFAKLGFITVNLRDVDLLDLAGLGAVIAGVEA